MPSVDNHAQCIWQYMTVYLLCPLAKEGLGADDERGWAGEGAGALGGWGRGGWGGVIRVKPCVIERDGGEGWGLVGREGWVKKWGG